MIRSILSRTPRISKYKVITPKLIEVHFKNTSKTNFFRWSEQFIKLFNEYNDTDEYYANTYHSTLDYKVKDVRISIPEDVDIDAFKLAVESAVEDVNNNRKDYQNKKQTLQDKLNRKATPNE